jgi:choline dehydrogenase
MAPFDYIIIGAGSSGGVLANRLSADPKIRVLLIEAGGSGRGLYHALPAGSLVMMGHPKYDWIYHTEPDPSLGGRVVQWAGGKALGGSSSMNGMVYVRGSRFDYDDWAAGGCAGWGFDDVLPYFRKMETFHGPPSQFHGAHGPLSVEPPREMNPAAHAFIRAAGELGLPIRDDYTDGDQYGAFECLATLDRGVRCSVRKAYIDEAGRRPNVTVLTNTQALDLVIDDGRAVGVRVRREDGQVETHCAQGEVIVSDPESGLRRTCRRSEFPWSWTCQASAPTCRSMAARARPAASPRRPITSRPARWTCSPTSSGSPCSGAGR